jgi:hypothetical protein
MPLVEMLRDIRGFLDDYPTELVYFNMAVDWTPIDDIKMCGWLRPSKNRDRVQTERLSREEMLQVL